MGTMVSRMVRTLEAHGVRVLCADSTSILVEHVVFDTAKGSTYAVRERLSPDLETVRAFLGY